jgi:hypothetical protein
MTRTIHCTVVEVPASDPLGHHPSRVFEDVVPWADPYILALVEKLRQSDLEDQLDDELSAELPPPPFGDDAPWQPDWSPRNWPR